jgi:RNA polymerase sigma-70 factor
MEKPLSLARIFRECAPERVDVPADDEKLVALLQPALEKAKAPWPPLVLPDDVFVRHLAGQLCTASPERTLAQELERRHLADLYLACACLEEVRGAVQLLEQHVLERLPAMLRPFRQPVDVLDEICQQVRIHLLVGTSQGGPKLETYGGLGALVKWAYAIASNMVPQQTPPRRDRAEHEVAAAFEALSVPGTHADLDIIKRRYGPEFRQTLREILATLPLMQQRMLRHYYVDGLKTAALGRIMGMDQSTAWRKLRSTHQAVYRELRRRLQERHSLSSQDFNSILDVIRRSQLYLTFSVLSTE